MQSLVEFKTSGALQWLSRTGPSSLLQRTGLAQALREGREFRSSRITNITLGGELVAILPKAPDGLWVLVSVAEHYPLISCHLSGELTQKSQL